MIQVGLSPPNLFANLFCFGSASLVSLNGLERQPERGRWVLIAFLPAWLGLKKEVSHTFVGSVIPLGRLWQLNHCTTAWLKLSFGAFPLIIQFPSLRIQHLLLKWAEAEASMQSQFLLDILSLPQPCMQRVLGSMQLLHRCCSAQGCRTARTAQAHWHSSLQGNQMSSRFSKKCLSTNETSWEKEKPTSFRLGMFVIA